MPSGPVTTSRELIRLETIRSLRDVVSTWRAEGDRIVLVPTMGALHRGHLTLVEHAHSIGQRVVASLFVNPTQFAPDEDFSRYPRDVDADLTILADAGVDAVWMPSVTAMYLIRHSTSIQVSDLTEGLCGCFRPGHFSGVATVVAKLLNQVEPDVALFGEKDFQQLQVIRRMVRDLNIDVAISAIPTVREHDGLALSSRNRYLSAEERQIAPVLHKTLQEIAGAIQFGTAVTPVLNDARKTLGQAGFSPVQYLSVCDAETLVPVERVESPARVFVAAYLGKTRLIDNVCV